MSPFADGQRRQVGVMASLGGSGVEECAEATVALHLLIAPSLHLLFQTGKPKLKPY